MDIEVVIVVDWDQVNEERRMKNEERITKKGKVS